MPESYYSKVTDYSRNPPQIFSCEFIPVDSWTVAPELSLIKVLFFTKLKFSAIFS